MVENVDLGLKGTSTITFLITKKVLMVIGEVDIGIRPDPITPITPAILVYRWVFLFMFIKEMDTGPRPDTLLHIDMVEYKSSTQGLLNNIFQGVCEEKIFKTVIKAVSYTQIKIILISIIQTFHYTLIKSCHHNTI